MEYRAHVFVEGRVQGVGYRAFVQNRADELGVFGWVKNLSDGRVEAMIEGEKEKVETLLQEMSDGPGLADVSKIEASFDEISSSASAFEIRY